MRKRINLIDVKLNSIIEKELEQNIYDILEFCPENTSIDIVIENLQKNKLFEVKFLLKGPGVKIYSSSQSYSIVESIVDCKRKVLNQFKRHRNKQVLERRKEKARYQRANRYKDVA